jgi:hypothetical protein
MTGEIVPFGKYKGQPVEVLAQDRPYLDWLSAQPWFRERFGGLHAIIINNFAEPTETPDHNALQVLFLEDGYCGRLYSALWPNWNVNAAGKLAIRLADHRQELIKRRGDYGNSERAEELAKAIAKYPTAFAWQTVWVRDFEKGGVDVQLHCSVRTMDQFPIWLGFGYRQGPIEDSAVYFDVREMLRPPVRIEIKPTIGDDYPAILRQMRAGNTNLLFTECYIGTGATEQQFVQTFALSQIKVVFRHQVESQREVPSEGRVYIDAGGADQ